MTEYRLSGFKELEDALLELGRNPAKRYGRKALREAGKPILEKYKAGTTVRSGRLVASETMGTKLNKRQRAMNKREGPSDVEIHIGTSDPAGLMEEFGIGQAAKPALTHAWDTEGGTTAIERIGKSLGDSIEKAARRAARRRG
jgi:hypothetical protein